MILQVTGQFPLLNWFCSKFSVHIKWNVVTHCLPSSLRFITEIDSSAQINVILFPVSPCSWATLCFCASGATHLEKCDLPLSLSCLPPALLQKVVKSLPNVHERKHWNVLLSQPFANNLTAYKLFKSNLARVLRTSNHILGLAAMTIFGHIFPFLQALHWLFFYYLLQEIYLPIQNFLRKSFFPLAFLFQPTERKKAFFFFFLAFFSTFFLAITPHPHPHSYWASTVHQVFSLLILRVSIQGRHYQSLGSSEEAKAWSRQVISSRPHN